MFDEVVNLLEETKVILEKHNLSLNDVVWVGCKEFRISIDKFIELANHEYSPGDDECVHDLLVVGNDWWLSRGYNDEFGSSWWNFNRLPEMPQRENDDVVCLVKNHGDTENEQDEFYSWDHYLVNPYQSMLDSLYIEKNSQEGNI